MRFKLPPLHRILGAGVAAVGIGVVLYLSWIPSPRMTEVEWVPKWLAGWADENGRLRTAIPFLLLGVLSGTGLAWRRKSAAAWGGVLLGLIALVATAEMGQIRIPGRVSDWRDVLWGGAGAALGMVVAWLGNQAVRAWIRRAGDGSRG